MAGWAFSTFSGVYATDPTLEGFELPIYPAEDGRAPLLQFWGDEDPVTPLADVAAFQAEYGGPADVVVLPGGGSDQSARIRLFFGLSSTSARPSTFITGGT